MKTLLLSALLLWPVSASAGPFDMAEDAAIKAGPVEFHGIVDMRAVRTSKRRSSLNQTGGTGGPGKLRYGGKDVDANFSGDRESTQASIPNAAVVLEATVLPKTRLHLHMGWDADFEAGNGAAGIVEAYATSEKRVAESDSLQLKLGAFIPPLSMEHPDVAWTTRYSLTPSAIATWAGEDLRAMGAEGSWNHRFNKEHSGQATFGIFSGSDQAGWVLLTRGWAMHDFTPDINHTSSLPTAETSRPFKELDGRPGFYTRFTGNFSKDLLQATFGYWDNNADKKVQTIGSHLDVYHTKFFDVGTKLAYKRATAIFQYLHGDVQSLSFSKREIDALHLLGSYDFDKWISSARFDFFKVKDLEKGFGITLAGGYKLSLRQQLMAEFALAETDPTNSSDNRTDRLMSVNYRLKF